MPVVVMDLSYGCGLSSRYRGIPLHGRYRQGISGPCPAAMAAARRASGCRDGLLAARTRGQGGAVGCETRGEHHALACRRLLTCSSAGTTSWRLCPGCSQATGSAGDAHRAAGYRQDRLAVACAMAYAERSGSPRYSWTWLGPDPALVVAELAQAVGVEPRGGTDLTGQLAAALGNEERLVVLDNCEHLLAAAPDVGTVLAACPRLRVPATSRERLRLSAEQELPVPPLAMPAPAEMTDVGCLAANPSVALLLDRARRTNPGFDLTSANAPLLASACVRLEGLPLAIELAAARLKVLTPGELVSRLSSRMEVLAGSTRDVPARHARCAAPLPGAMTCSTPASGHCFASCRCSPAAGRSRTRPTCAACPPVKCSLPWSRCSRRA